METINLSIQKEPWEEPAIMELPINESQNGGYTTDDGSFAPSLS